MSINMALHAVERYAEVLCVMCANAENFICAQAARAFIPFLEKGTKNLIAKRGLLRTGAEFTASCFTSGSGRRRHFRRIHSYP
jgi:hypothetical protein